MADLAAILSLFLILLHYAHSSAIGRITCAVINTSNEVKCPLLWEF